MKISAGQCSFDCGFYCKHLTKWITLEKISCVKAEIPQACHLHLASTVVATWHVTGFKLRMVVPAFCKQLYSELPAMAIRCVLRDY